MVLGFETSIRKPAKVRACQRQGAEVASRSERDTSSPRGVRRKMRGRSRRERERERAHFSRLTRVRCLSLRPRAEGPECKGRESTKGGYACTGHSFLQSSFLQRAPCSCLQRGFPHIIRTYCFKKLNKQKRNNTIT